MGASTTRPALSPDDDMPGSLTTIQQTQEPTMSVTTEPALDPLPASTIGATAASTVAPTETSMPDSLPVTIEGSMTMWSDFPTIIVGGSWEYANAAIGGVVAPSASSPYVAARAYCAADSNLYQQGAACGACFRVSYDGSKATDSGRPGSLVVQIVDSGSAKTFDCQVDAFETITGSRTGIFPISYEPVDCETATDGPVATVLDGNNAWYTKVIFSNLPGAVVSADNKISGKSFGMSRVG